MSTFEFVMGLHSVVIGIAASQLLSTLGATIRYRDGIRYDWVHTAWCVICLFSLVGVWFGLGRVFRDAQSMHVFEFLGMFTFPVCYAIATRLLVLEPAEGPEFDLRIQFEKVRRPFFVTMALPSLAGNATMLVMGYETNTVLIDVVSQFAFVGFCVVGFMSPDWRVQRLLCIGWIVVYLPVEWLQAPVGG